MKPRIEPVPRATASGDKVPHTPAPAGTPFIHDGPTPPLTTQEPLVDPFDSLPTRSEIIEWRTQNDGLNDVASQATGIEFDWDNHKTDQSAAPATEIEFMMRNHIMRADRAPQYIEFDYSIDLQQAIAMGNTLRDAQLVAPEELRSKYPDKYAILQGVETGEYARDLQNLEKEQRLNKQLEELRTQAKAGAPIPPLTQSGTPEASPKP